MKTFVMVTKLAPEHIDPVDVAHVMKDRADGGTNWQIELMILWTFTKHPAKKLRQKFRSLPVPMAPFR
jgi:hypothetical protein